LLPRFTDLSSDEIDVDSDTGGIPILEELGLRVVSYLRIYSVCDTAPLSSCEKA